jgi:hypothetical protein
LAILAQDHEENQIAITDTDAIPILLLWQIHGTAAEAQAAENVLDNLGPTRDNDGYVEESDYREAG